MLFFVVVTTTAHPQNFADTQQSVPGITINARELPWANPLDGGKIRLLLAAPRHTLGDAAELARHLQTNPEIVPFPPPFFEGEPIDPTAWLVAALPGKADVLLIANYGPLAPDLTQLRQLLPETLGAVTVRFGNQPPPIHDPEETVEANVITRGVGLDLWPDPDLTHPIITAATGESGRTVDIHYPTPAPAVHALLPPAITIDQRDWTLSEAQWAIVARAVRWAAHREAEIEMTGITPVGPEPPPLEEVPPFLPQEYVDNLGEQIPKPALRPFEITFNQPTDRRYTLRYRARYPYRDIPAWTMPLTDSVPKGVITHTIDVPIGHGSVFLDLWLDHRRDTVDWFSAPLYLQAWPEIDTFRVLPNVVLPNGSVNVEFRVRGHFQQPRTSVAYVRARDGYNRLLAEKYVYIPEEGGEVTAELAITGAMGTHIHVEAYVADRRRPPFTQWELERSAYRGVFIPLRSESDEAFTFMADGIATAEPGAEKLHRRLREMGVTLLHVDPEWDRLAPGAFLSNLPVLPHTARYREESGVGGLERHPCFTDPTFINAETNRIQQLTRELWPFGGGTYSLGDGNCIVANEDELCRSESCMNNFGKYLARNYPGIAQLNAAWKTNFDSFASAARYIPASEIAAPWLDFRRYMDNVFLNAHLRAANAIRSVDPEARVGFCGEDHPHPQAGIDWSTLASRLDFMVVPESRVEEITGVWNPRARLIMKAPPLDDERTAAWLPWHAALNRLHGIQFAGETGIELFGQPDPAFAALSASAIKLQDGFAQLLRQSIPDNNEVLLLNSHADHYLDAFNGAENPVAMSNEWRAALSESGYAYRIIPESTLELPPVRNAPAILLPNNRVMSENTIATLKNLKSEGVVVLAGKNPGTHDSHGSSRAAATTVVTRLIDNPAKLASALLEAEIFPMAHEIAEVDQDFSGSRAHLRFGAAEIFAFLQDPAAAARKAKVSIRAADNQHTYILTNEELFPGRRKATLSLVPGEPGIVSILPYEVARVHIDAPGSVVAGDRINLHVSVRTLDALPGDHLVQVSIALFGGTPLRHYGRTVHCPGGQGDTYIPTALDERPGNYIITVRDLLTGTIAEHPITIFAEQPPQ